MLNLISISFEFYLPDWSINNKQAINITNTDYVSQTSSLSNDNLDTFTSTNTNTSTITLTTIKNTFDNIENSTINMITKITFDNIDNNTIQTTIYTTVPNTYTSNINTNTDNFFNTSTVNISFNTTISSEINTITNLVTNTINTNINTTNSLTTNLSTVAQTNIATSPSTNSLNNTGIETIPVTNSFTNTTSFSTLSIITSETQQNSSMNNTYLPTEITASTYSINYITSASATSVSYENQNATLIIINPTTTQPDNLADDIKFECSNKPNGYYRDPKFCDVYHICLNFKESIYFCPQNGDRFYFDELTKQCEKTHRVNLVTILKNFIECLLLFKCDFNIKITSGCPSNNYYQQIIKPITEQSTISVSTETITKPATSIISFPISTSSDTKLPITDENSATDPPKNPPTNQPTSFVTLPTNGGYGNQVTNAPGTNPAVVLSDAWKLYIREKELFSCSDKPDGFYPSRWCNVFYRCYQYLKYEFLCAKQTNGDRLWWTQHSTSSTITQEDQAQCAFPCDTKRKCTSPGGVLIENGNMFSDSVADANRISNSCTQDNVPVTLESCSGVAEGTFLVDSQYCNRFGVCAGGKRRDFVCAKTNNKYDLWWNDATKACDWPCKVQCSKQIFGSSRNASEIQSIDKTINAYECGSSDSSLAQISSSNLSPYG